MSMLSDFFLADNPADALAYHGGEGGADDRCEFKMITALEAAGMLAALRGGGDSVEYMAEFELLSEEEAEEWTMSVPGDMVTLLGELTDEQLRVTAAQAAKATEEELGWSGEDFEPVIVELRRLARRAINTGKRMFLWNSL